MFFKWKNPSQERMFQEIPLSPKRPEQGASYDGILKGQCPLSGGLEAEPPSYTFVSNPSGEKTAGVLFSAKFPEILHNINIQTLNIGKSDEGNVVSKVEYSLYI